jgi:hypothetical protein
MIVARVRRPRLIDDGGRVDGHVALVGLEMFDALRRVHGSPPVVRLVLRAAIVLAKDAKRVCAPMKTIGSLIMKSKLTAVGVRLPLRACQ